MKPRLEGSVGDRLRKLWLAMGNLNAHVRRRTLAAVLGTHPDQQPCVITMIRG